MRRFLTILVLAALALAAQDKKLNDDPNTRSVQGVVTSAGNPVNGAVVQLKDTKSLQIRSYVTHGDGEYHFAGLSTNVDYELKADKDGQTSGTKRLSNFDGRKTATVNLQVK